MKKLLATVLAVLLLVSVCPFGTFSITASALTRNNAVNAIEAHLQKIRNVYPDGSYFTKSGGSHPIMDYSICPVDPNNPNGMPFVNCDCSLREIPSRGGLPSGATVANETGDGWSCNAFALYCFYLTFDISPWNCDTVTEPSYGDYVVLNGYTHYGIYLGQDDNYIYLFNSNGNRETDCVVSYNQAFSKSIWWISTIKHAPNYDEVQPPCSKHNFNASSVCTECGYSYDYKSTKVNFQGTVQATENIYVRKTPYEVGDLVNTYSSGTQLAVTGKVVNGYGHEWYVVVSEEGNMCYDRYVVASKLKLLSHTCQKGEYEYSLEAHPHYNSYKCKICDKSIVDYNSSNFSSNCNQCSGIDISAGTYAIKNNSTGTYMCVSYGTDANEQNVDLYGEINSASKMIISAAPNGYKIRPECSASRLINPFGDTVTSGQNVNIYNDVNDSSQWWRFQSVSGGYIIRNVQNPNCVLDTDGGNVFVSSYTGASTQIWSLCQPSNPSLATPSISFDKSSYTIGDTITISWQASPSGSNLSHYWITIYNPDGSVCIDQSAQKNTTFSFTASNVGTYSVKIYATPVGSQSGEGSLTDTKSITVISAHTHSYGSWIERKSATCTATGILYRVCSCGNEETKTIDAFGHYYISSTTQPTCISGGYTTHTCKRCSSSYVDNYIDPIGHRFSEWTVRTNATCTTNGIEYRVCRCGIEETRKIDAKHNFVNNVCTICGTIDGILYILNDGKATITGYDGNGETIVIPKYIDGYEVVVIGYSAFANCTSLTSITIPDSVTSIDSYAFENCTSLTSITIPDSVASIGISAFENCTSLTSITVPNSVTSIGSYAFKDCDSLTSITIPDSVTNIEEGVFYDCINLTSITIPDSVTHIGAGAFTGTEYLNTASNWEEDVIYIGNHLINCNVTKIGAYIIKDGTKCIANHAFENCIGLNDITIPNSVISIGSAAFSNCYDLASITIPDSVIHIGKGAFTGTKYLNTASNWEEDVLYIGNHLIRCKVTKTGAYIIKDGTKCIAHGAFENCTSLTNITISDSVTSINGVAFSNCYELTSVTIPDSVTYIGSGAFLACFDLKNVYYLGTEIQKQSIIIGVNDYLIEATWHYESCIGSAEHTYTNGADTTCNVCGFIRDANVDKYTYTVENGEAIITEVDSSISGDVVIPSTLGGYPVTSIGRWAFEGCTSLTRIIIPDSVTSIGDYAFGSCDSLTSITIPNSVISIGSNAFIYCYGLTNVTIPDSVTSIGDGVFYCCYGLTSVTIGNGITSISDEAFYYCFGLTSITIPDSVISIGEWAFYCSSLTSVTIPDSVTSIGERAFSSCGLKSVTIPDSVISIGSYAFSSCGLTSVTIPDSVTSIGDGAFFNCTSIESISVESENIVYHSKDNCLIETAVNELILGCKNSNIPNYVTSIGGRAFYYCDGITSITIPESVTSIGEGAFEDCTELKTVYYLGTETQKQSISIDSDNDYLTSATWHYGSCENHTYDNNCDEECNICGSIRNVSHTYEWVIDKSETCGENGIKHEECTVCHIKRNENTIIDATGNHTYDNACDTTCNICGNVISYISGDVNDNGKVNMEDLALLLRFVSDWDVQINELAADVDRNGVVNVEDLAILLRYLSDWDVELK